MSGREARARRQAGRKERQRQRKAARACYAAALPGPLELLPDGRALCPHYRPGAVGGDWTVIEASQGGGGYDVAVCPACMAYMFGPAAARLFRGVAA